jgi:hypothetical protein
MNNPLRGETQINLGTETYNARLTIDSLIKIEEEMGVGLIRFVQDLSENMDISISNQITILYHALRGGGNDFSITDIKKIIVDAGILECTKEILTLVTSALNDEEDDSEEKKAEVGA